MSSENLSDAQTRLRKACQTGDLAALQQAVSAPQSRTPGLTRALWHRLRGIQESESLPASLAFVYEDDQCNLPIHYLGTGAPVSSVQRFILGCLPLSRQSKQAGNYDLQRATLVHWLTTHGHALNLLAVNSKLETGLHCAINSNSPIAFQALLVAAAGSTGLTEACLAQTDIAEHTALDLAFLNTQWFMVQLLVTAGALAGCPGLHKARVRLHEALPLPAGTAQSGLASLVSGISKAFAAFLNPGAQGSPQSTTDTPIPEPQMKAVKLETAVPYADTGCSPSSALVFLQHLEAVLQHRQAAVCEVATQCGESQNVAAFLLDQYQGNTKAACTAWDSTPYGVLQDAGMSPEVAQQMVGGSRAQTGAQQCLVCYEAVKAARSKVQLPCGHCTCDECWKGIVTAASEAGDVKQAACPLPGCRLPISPAQISSVVDRQAAMRFQQLLAQHHVNTNPLIRWCPSPSCSGCVVLQPQAADSGSSNSGLLQALEAGRSFDVVCGCRHAFCFACAADAHEPATCQQAVQWGDTLAHMREEDKQNATQWVRHHTQPCPGCGSRIQKNGGCNHMSCAVCRRQFCWICGGDWAKHSTDTGGYFRCNIAAPPPQESTPVGADLVQGRASGQPAPEAEQSAGLLGSLFGKFADAGAKWKLDYFMRRFLAHECSERQLQVSMQWIRGLLISGTSADFWRHHQLDIQQQNGHESLPSSSSHHSHHQQQHQQPQQQQQQESQCHQGPLQHQANEQQQQQQPTIDPTVSLPIDLMDALQQQAVSHSHQQAAAFSESGRHTQPASLLPPPVLAPTNPSPGAIQQPAAASESGGCAPGAPFPHNRSTDSDPGIRAPATPPSRPRHWLGLNPLLHTHVLQGYRSSPQYSRAETASTGSSRVTDSQPGPSLVPTQQPCVQLPAMYSYTDVMLGMSGRALSCTGVPHRVPADAATDAQTDAWDAQGVADLQRGANAQGGSDAGAADAQGGADARGGADKQGGAQGGADSVYGYLEKLPQELVACRRVLQYSFVLEYYMQASANQTRLLEGLQAQLTALVEQLSMPLALLPSSNLLLEVAPEVLQKQLELIPGTSTSNHVTPQASLQARLEAISKGSVTEDGGMTLPGLSQDMLQQQFMFAVAVHEGAAQTRRLLGQMQQARQSLLQAARTGAFSDMQSSAAADGRRGVTPAQTPGSITPSLSQVAQAVKFLWQGRN